MSIRACPPPKPTFLACVGRWTGETRRTERLLVATFRIVRNKEHATRFFCPAYFARDRLFAANGRSCGSLAARSAEVLLRLQSLQAGVRAKEDNGHLLWLPVEGHLHSRPQPG